MSVKVIALPMLAAAVAVAVFSLVLGRRESPNQRPSLDKMRTEEKPMGRRATPQRGRSQLKPQQIDVPREMVLPLAFWDAALELQSDDDNERTLLPPDSYEAFDTDQLLDKDDLGAQWVARATRSDDTQGLDDVNDPAEIAADSGSMISEASRSAASAYRAEMDEDSERGVQSSSATV